MINHNPQFTCQNCKFGAKYKPLCGEKESVLRCVRYAPKPKLSNVCDLEAYEKYFPNYPVVAKEMYCGEFELG